MGQNNPKNRLTLNYANRIIDYPKIEHIYQSYPGDTKTLYGKGFTYSKIVEDLPVCREGIEEQILQKEFDLII